MTRLNYFILLYILSLIYAENSKSPRRKSRHSASDSNTMNTEKKSIECSSNEIFVQVIDKRLESNGCSKPSFIQVKGEEDFTYCCDRHDACYATCGSSKEFCDNDFEKCMKGLCNSIFSQNVACSNAASTYAMGTQMFGSNGFILSQQDYCICVDKSKVLDHYADYIDNFYQTYVPIHPPPTNGKILIEKSKNAKETSKDSLGNSIYGNLYKIVYELHKKYDQAIKHIDTRIGKKPPQPLVKTNEL